MFQKYEIADNGLTSNSENPVNIDVIDSDFTERIVAIRDGGGMDIMTPLIFLYESKGLNVPANIAKAYVYLCNRFNLEPKPFLDRMIIANKTVAKYKNDIEKYIALI